ncbi:MAG: hypothetical protein WCT23_02825 [Candidatus Neomarinimicrobiota bacterium]
MNKILTYPAQLLDQQNQLSIVVVYLVLFLILLFILITFSLIIVTSFLRIKNITKAYWQKKLYAHWDSVFLALIDEKISCKEAFDKIRRRDSIAYLMYLERYISMLKGREKVHLVALGRMSSEKLHRLVNSSQRRRRLYGIHFLSLFHPEEQISYLRYDKNDIEFSLTMIRELIKVDKYEIKEQLLRILFKFRYVSPVYLSIIMAEMGSEIIPLLVMVIEYERNDPFKQMVAMEALRRLHYSKGAELSKYLLENTMYPLVAISCLNFIEDMGDESHQHIVKLYMKHSNPLVRSAAAQAYIAITPNLSEKDIIAFFDDESVVVAVKAARKLKDKDLLPYVSVGKMDYLKWGIVYKRMVF